MSIDQPLNVNPWYSEARAFVRGLGDRLSGLSDAILDDWGGGPRIIYGGYYVENCCSHCVVCPLHLAVGVDDETDHSLRLRTTLCLPNKRQATLVHARHRFLNCKTPYQYMECFVQWCLCYCESEELLLAELDWIRGFRVLMIRGITEETILKSVEREAKIRILSKVFAQHPSEKMRALVDRYAHDNGLAKEGDR